MADDLQALEHWAEPLLQRITSGERAKLARSIGTALRRSQHERIQAQKNPDGSGYLPRKRIREKAGRIKRKAGSMFRRISRNDYLRIKASDSGVSIGFTGRVARIAGAHQRGETEQIATGGTRVRYSIRELLGFTQQDREMIRHMLVDHLGA